MVTYVCCRDSYKVYVIVWSVSFLVSCFCVSTSHLAPCRPLEISIRAKESQPQWLLLERFPSLQSDELEEKWKTCYPCVALSLPRTSLWSSSKCHYFCPHFILNKLFSHMRWLLLTFVFTFLSLFLSDQYLATSCSFLSHSFLSFPLYSSSSSSFLPLLPFSLSPPSLLAFSPDPFQFTLSNLRLE